MLKREGIVDVDVDKAEPYWVRKAGPRGGTYTLAELIDKYDPIISGKAKPVKLSPEKTAFYKKQGYETVKGDRIIVPHVAGGKVKVNKQGDFYRIEPPGIKTTTLPVEYKNLKQYLREAKKTELKHGRGKQFAFRFFGGHSMTYSSIDLLIEDLEAYESVHQAINRRSSKDMNEIFRNLEIVETTKSAWKAERATTARIRESQRKHDKPHARKRRLRRAERMGLGDVYREKRAAEARKYRANMSPAQKEAYRAKARARKKRNRK